MDEKEKKRVRSAHYAHPLVARRDLFRGAGGALAGLVTAGCCSVDLLTPVGAPFDPTGTPLAPSMVVKSTLAPPLCIDVHAHFFNASDVQVKDYIGECVAHDFRPVLHRFGRLLGKQAECLAGLAPTAREELNHLRILDEQLSRLTAEDAEAALQKATNDDLDRVYRDLSEALRNTAFAREYRRIKRDARFSGAVRSDTLDADDLRAISESVRHPSSEMELDEADRLEADLDASNFRLPYPDGVIAFAIYMCLYRCSQLTLYRHAYTCSRNAFGVNRVLGALVDFDHWLETTPTPSSHDDQIQVQLALSRMSKGYMRPLVGYNPKVDVLEPDNPSLERLLKAWNHEEFVGVKIYPPTGFRPDAPDAPAIKGKLKAFFDECAARDIPIMAHSSESRGRTEADDQNGGPEGWTALLAQYAGAAKVPIVNIAHFGGMPPERRSKDDSKNEWTADFVDLMAKPGSERVYGDLGFWDELMRRGDREEARRRLMDAVSRHGGLAKDRVMYGSDWLMLSLANRWPDYPARLARALKEVFAAENLFGQNALRCFPRLASS